MRNVDCELAHGWTLGQIHQLARLAVHTAGSMAGDWRERYETAWMGIVETLYAAPHWPTRHTLVQAGQVAIYRAVDEHLQAYGYYRRKTDGAVHGAGSSPAWRAYWWELLSPLAYQSPERGVVERVALAQIWPTLTDGQRQAIASLAAHDNDFRSAAAAIGATSTGFRTQVSKARARFLAAWHEGERPSRQWRLSGRAYIGGARTRDAS
jgi:hypothetical protein